MTHYYIDYNTGAGNDWIEGTLEDAKELATKDMVYTQENVHIYEITKEEYQSQSLITTPEPIIYLPWNGVTPDDDEIITAQFGDFGYYGEWLDY